MTRCEHNGGVIKDINVLLSEILYRKRLNTNKRLEYKLNAIFLSQVKIGRLACCRLRL